MNDKPDLPMILILVSDLFFAVSIEETCRKLQLFPQALDAHNLDQTIGKGSEKDRNQRFLEFINQVRPAMMIVDLNKNDLPWREWIALVKSSPAGAGLPVLCFGPHINTLLMNAGHEAGADVVVARSRFMGSMEELIVKYARKREV
jgi:hypothetical protein